MVLASDSRGTFGDPRGVTAQNDNMQKIMKCEIFFLPLFVVALVSERELLLYDWDTLFRFSLV